jgi:hypothetical protein
VKLDPDSEARAIGAISDMLSAFLGTKGNGTAEDGAGDLIFPDDGGHITDPISNEGRL